MKKSILMIVMLVFSAFAMVSCEKDDDFGSHHSGGSIGNVPDGAVPGLFTVNSNGKQVFFSNGNLRYRNYNFEFEANQWTMRPSHNVSDCGHFFWASSASKATASSYNSSWNGETSFFADNGGAIPGWRVLTRDEWRYLLNVREVNGGTGYGYTCVSDTINGVFGLIIFRDGYRKNTTGLTSIPEGCVFLPAAGCRSDGIIEDADFYGGYWSSTTYGSYSAYDCFFSRGGLYVSENDDYEMRYWGLSVRLVIDR